MKVHQLLCLVCAVVLALPVSASAEVYKWKDKNGKVNYTDTPPPVSVKSQMIGKEKIKRPANQTAPSPSRGAVRERFEEKDAPEEEAARLRRSNAETERRNKVEKEKTAKLNAENCKAAKSNYATFSQGGRIYKTNENGDREYYGDDELNSQKLIAQANVRKFCK